LDSCPLKLGYRSQDVHLQPSRRRGRVDALVKAHERNSKALEILEERDKVLQVSAEPIQPPAHDDIKPPTSCVSDQLIEGRSAVFGTANAGIHILAGGPSARFNVLTEFSELVFCRLLRRGDSRVDRSPVNRA
jgi:hypothetical protein